ncbi:heterokaryon incompatibility protein-domain-containing protein [Cladorrhinum sp. PSN332]|nr:heterokaryon incompatibility protein-domain-containing protein [Cladorrhinum sp. PSN332]
MVPLSRNSTIKLGPLEQIRRRSCSLCQLVAQATHTVQRTENRYFQPDQHVELLWLVCEQTISKPAFNLVYPGLGPSHGTSLCFVSQDYSARASSVRHNNVWFRRIENVVIDFQRVRGWLLDCEENHLTCPRSAAADSSDAWEFPGLRLMRFIDVERRCIVEKTTTCRYIALSYVWGSASGIKLSKLNRHRLMEPGSLNEAWRLIPRTVKDAIELVRQLGERYLWVDSLCLIQNDPEDVKAGTSVMDLVYGSSALTVVAACGLDSFHGLPGMHSGSRSVPFYFSQVLPGLQLTIYTDLRFLLESTVYASRGWTFQEERLSSRVLYFVNDQIYFRCASHLQAECCLDSDTDFQEQTHSSFQPLAIPDAGSGDLYTMLLHYMNAIQDYTWRSLTYQEDAYNAVAGTIRSYESNSRFPFISGLPSKFLEPFITFRACHASLRRRKGFPSYSWTGWVGAVTFPFVLIGSCTNLNLSAPKIWIKWFCTVTTANPHRQQPSPVSALRQLPHLPLNPSSAVLRIAQHPRRNSIPSNYPVIMLQTHPLPTQQTLASQQEASIPSYPLLRFWTLSINLRLGEANLQSVATLVNNRGQVGGELLLDGHDESTFFDDQSREGNTLELLVLMEGYWRLNQVFEQESIEKGLCSDFRSYVIVMCIEWLEFRGPDSQIIHIAERRGVGQVLLDSVPLSCYPGPVWKEITLG